MQWYKEGTISVNNDSPIVTGVGTLWLLQVNPGDIFTTDGERLYEIEAVDSNIQITLALPYVGVSVSNHSYAIVRNFTSTTNAILAAKIAELLAGWQNRENELADWQGGTATGGPASDGLYPLTDALGNVVQAKSIAKIEADVSATVAIGISSGTATAISYSEEWATKPENTLVSTAAGGNGVNDYSAFHHAAKALASENAAAASVTAATIQANAAAASSAAITATITAATTAAVVTATTDATNQALAAAAAATTATNQANNSADSATASAASAATATTKATVATDQAAASLASATASATKANEAAVSAISADADATSAASSAAASASSATSASTSSAAAINTMNSIINLQYLQDFGSITDAAGTTSDYGSLI